MFRKLSEKEIALVQKHKEKNGTRSANVYRANLMRGKTHKEADKLAKERAPQLPARRTRRKKADIAPEQTEVATPEPTESEPGPGRVNNSD